MKARDFLTKLEHDQIVDAIAEAEKKTSGEIRVFISRKEPDDAVKAAEKAFAHLGMHRLKEKNGVLIFVAPRVRQFAVIGDSAVHQKCGNDFWKQVVHEISSHFRNQEFTQGVLHGIARAGQLLADHFPATPSGGHQPPHDIAGD